MRKFYKPVDKRSRQAMTAFLEGHFRYPTANSWNQATSYACNLKVHKLGFEQDITMKLFDLIQTDAFFKPFQDLMHHFAAAYNQEWQAGMNGRSGGYLVLYQGGRKPSEYKSFCVLCGQRNFKSVAESGPHCGVCKKPARMDFITPPMQTFTYPGRGTDMDADYADWSMHELRGRVELVQAFDHLADTMVATALHMAKSCSVEEEVFLVEHKKPVMVPAS